MIKTTAFRVLTIAALIIAMPACSKYYFRSTYNNANKLLFYNNNWTVKPFLKAHLKNGDICILKDTWKVDTTLNVVTGSGAKYDFNRKKVSEGLISVPIDSVVIFETNKKIEKPESARIMMLGVLAGLDVIVSIICITNPKACFGSCPTFYLNENDNIRYADAEGFSNAITPSMEYADIDALNNTQLSGNVFSLTMKNEALETHCIRDVKLLACPRKNGERIYQSSSDEFYRCENNYSLARAKANEGDITALLRSPDREERYSLSDEDNLSSKEEIYLSFENVENENNLGLILNFRQTLMTTYFIYSAMGYMGNEVGNFFARLESDKATKDKLKDGIKKELGNIDVYLWNDQKNEWEIQDELYETGPIAINSQFVPLKDSCSGSEVNLKLVVNKGLWRFDYAALTNIKEKVKPVEISPISILNKGRPDNSALKAIKEPDDHLISMPGSAYKFNFILPDRDTDYELFLYSKGYYMEWMRAHWLEDKDLPKLKQMVQNPGKYLKKEANNYKQYESVLEQEFWNSKVDTKTFSYDEN